VNAFSSVHRSFPSFIVVEVFAGRILAGLSREAFETQCALPIDRFNLKIGRRDSEMGVVLSPYMVYQENCVISNHALDAARL
jgi:hypothetical protein